MRTIESSFRGACSVSAFWDAFMDPAYLRALYMDGLGFKGFDILEQTDSSRKLRIVPKMNLPETLARIVGDAFAYEEHGTLDRKTSEWTWRMVQPKAARLPELITTRGKVVVTPEGDGACRRQDELTIEGKLFGLGRLIESTAEKEARAAWAKEEPFFASWLARRSSSSTG
jgi:hypothetical protein